MHDSIIIIYIYLHNNLQQFFSRSVIMYKELF